MRKLFVLLFLAVLPLAMSADSVEVNGLWYELNTDTSPTAVVINPQDGSSYSGDIVIPSTIPYEGAEYTVTEIGSWSFCWNNDIHSIVIPSTITAIGDGAFMGCNNLAYIISNIQVAFDVPKNAFCNSDYAIGETVNYNSSSAILYVPVGSLSTYQSHSGWDMFPIIFEGERLEDIVDNLRYAYTTASSAATVIKDDYNSMEDVIIPSSVTIGGSSYSVKAIGSSAFYNCYNIHSISFNEGLEVICRSAFNACWNATFGVLPSTIQHVGSEAFFSCGRISKLIIPEGCKAIDSNAFSWCDLQKLELPSTLTRIGERAFIGSRNLAMAISHIVNPYAIQNNVFCKEEYWNENGQSYDKSDAKLYVPSGTKSAYEALDGWNMFADIIEGEPKEATVDGITYSYVEGQGTATVIGRADEELRNISIPATVSINGKKYNVKEVGVGAFQGCGIDTLIIQEGVEVISRNAFRENWGNLRSVTLPTSLRTIGEGAFYYCYGIRNLIIPNGVTSIGKEAFRQCYNIQKLELPATLTSIGEYAFYPARNLSIVTSRIINPFEIGQSVFCSDYSSYWDNTEQKEVYSYTKSEATLYVPNGTKSAYQAIDGWNMFADIIEGELKETTVNGLNYSYLEGKGVATVIGRADENLNDITIPGSVTINGKAYAVKTIGVGAFYDLSLQSVTIEDGVETIEKQAFWDSDGISKLVLPSTLKTIGDEAFTYAYITDLVLPEGLISIGQGAFRSCYRIKKLELPSTLTSIGENAFYPTRDLSVVSSKIATPFEIGQSVFCSEYSSSWDETQQKDVYTYTPSSATLYVPDGTKSAYEAIAGWNMFADIVEGELKEATVDGLTYSYLVGKGNATVISGDYSEMKEVTIPGSVTIDGSRYTVKEIGADAFRNCSIETLVVQNGVDVIGEGAFRYNYSLHSVSLPTSLRTICKEAFYNCRIDTLVVPGGVETIGERAFSYQWSSIKSVTFPSTLRSIGREAFRSCTGIQKLELPASLTSIDEFAFAGMDNLSSVTSRITNPFEISESVFCSEWSSTYDEDQQKQVFTYTPSKANLYVPDGTLAKYQAIPGWKIFANIIEGELKEAKVGNLNYSYLVGKGNATVISGDYSELHNVTIPGTVTIDGTKYTVKEIGAGAFRDCNSLDTLIIESGVEVIGKEAFRYCHYLKSITLNEGVKTIGDRAFYESCNWIGERHKLVLPSTLTTIGEWAFTYCNLIQKLELPASLTSIGDFAFAGINDLNSVTSRITNPFVISESVFCSEWSSTYDEDQQKEIFTYTPSKANLYVPDGTLAKYQAFSGWKMFAGMFEGELQEQVVGDLKYAYLPSTLTATVVAGDYSELSKVTIPGTVTISGTTYQVKEIGTGAFRNCGQLDSVVIDNGVETIGKEAFYSCWNTTFTKFPSSLRTIGESAFHNCNNIRILDLPEGLLTIGNNAFVYCYGLQKVILPSTLTSIGERAFASTNNLSMVVSHIQNPFEISLSVFGYNNGWNSETQSYDYTPRAATLYVPEGTTAKYEALEGWMMFANMFEGELIEYSDGTLTYTFNNSSKIATVIKGENYNKLTKVTVPATITVDGVTSTVKTISARAFSGTPVTSVEMVDGGVEMIEQEAFQSCSQLTSISLPSSLTAIDDGAFRDCNRLTSVTIPASVISIGQSLFSGCQQLKSIVVADGNMVYESRNSNAIIESSTNTLISACETTVIPNSVTAIGREAFVNLGIKEIQIPGSVKVIGENAFNSCHNLTEVSFPEGLETISSTAFFACSNLNLIEFPNSLKEIEGWAFGDCNNLLTVVSNIEAPKALNPDVFGENSNVYSRATLWVPKGKVQTYKATEGWNRFERFDSLLHENLAAPAVKYDGRHLSMTIPEEQHAQIYYSLDGSKPSILYSDTLTLSSLVTVNAIARRFGSYTVDTTRYVVDYLYDGVTAHTASGGLLSKAFEWSGTDKIETLEINGTLNDEDYATIRSMSKLRTLNMSAVKLANGAIPAEAFANTNLQWFISPYSMTSVGSNIFKGCQQLAAITWNSSTIELPQDVATDVANPNMLVYAKAQAMIPYALKNVIINGVANNIILADSEGNCDFRCPVEFTARRISYTHNYQQLTARGVTQGWETLALPFTVTKITHETKGEITPSSVEGAQKPFWLYELGDNGLEKATQIRAHVPYLICMPNNDAYGDEYILGGRVTFSANNVVISTSGGTAVSQGNRQFVPTYQRVAKANNVYALNIGEAYGGNPVGSVFVADYRDVRPFEAYSVHDSSRARIISINNLGSGDATGIFEWMLKDDGESADAEVKVYTLSGSLIKQGRREEVLRSLPKGLYIINGKKVIK